MQNNMRSKNHCDPVYIFPEISYGDTVSDKVIGSIRIAPMKMVMVQRSKGN